MEKPEREGIYSIWYLWCGPSKPWQVPTFLQEFWSLVSTLCQQAPVRQKYPPPQTTPSLLALNVCAVNCTFLSHRNTLSQTCTCTLLCRAFAHAVPLPELSFPNFYASTNVSWLVLLWKRVLNLHIIPEISGGCLCVLVSWVTDFISGHDLMHGPWFQAPHQDLCCHCGAHFGSSAPHFMLSVSEINIFLIPQGPERCETAADWSIP